jgi:hypothetical protein
MSHAQNRKKNQLVCRGIFLDTNYPAFYAKIYQKCKKRWVVFRAYLSTVF